MALKVGAPQTTHPVTLKGGTTTARISHGSYRQILHQALVPSRPPSSNNYSFDFIKTVKIGFTREVLGINISCALLGSCIGPIITSSTQKETDFESVITGLVAGGAIGFVSTPLSVIALFATIELCFFVPASIRFAKQTVARTWRQFRFNSEYRHLMNLAEGSSQVKEKQLAGIMKRLTDSHLIAEISANWDFGVLAMAQDHGLISQQIVDSNAHVQSLIQEAETSCDSARLSILAENPVWQIRRACARNAGTPESALGKMINHDPVKAVREVIANNPLIVTMIDMIKTSHSPDELALFADKPFPCVRQAAAENTHTSAIVIERLIKDPRFMVRLAAGKNPRLPAKQVAGFLSRLKKDTYYIQKGVRYIPPSGYVADSACHDGETGHYENPGYDEPIYESRRGYVGASLELAQTILACHDHQKTAVLMLVQQQNPELYSALTNPVNQAQTPSVRELKNKR